MADNGHGGFENPAMEMEHTNGSVAQKDYQEPISETQIDLGLKPRLCHLRKWDDFSGYGLDVQTEKGKTGAFIGRVDFGSPAMVTGLKPGDKIIEVNGEPVGNNSDISHTDVVRRILANPDHVTLLLADDATCRFYENQSQAIHGRMENVIVTHCPEEKPDMTNYKVSNGDMNGDTSKDKEDDGKKKKEEKPKTVSAMQVFRFASCTEVILMVMGSICAMIHGAGLPMLMVVFGDMVDLFIENSKLDNLLQSIPWTNYGTTYEEAKTDQKEIERIVGLENRTGEYNNIMADTLDDLLDEMSKFSVYYVIIACCVLVCAYVQVSFWLMSAYRQGQKMREKLFRNMIRQNIGWFDTHEIGELNTRLVDDISKVLSGIGDKIGNFFQWFSCSLTGIIIGFVYGWKLTLVILAVGPLLAMGGVVMTKMASAFTEKELKAYAKAGAVAEEVLSSIRTVAAFGGEEKEAIRYEKNLDDAKAQGIRKGLANGLGIGFIYVVFFGSYALAFWYGSKLVREGEYTAGEMLIIFFAVVIGAFALGNAAPNLENFGVAQGAAYALWEIMDTNPPIDSLSKEGKKPNSIIGNIEFRGVKFSYPSRKEIPVLKGIDLEVNTGQTVALVGSSGSGKSTVIQLIQRFYDPDEGGVHIDGNNIRDLNVHWLRNNIGIVSQEPILFATTIAENIRFGRDNVTQAEIDQACIDAKAYEFIQKLPKKYETMVGERGTQLSGGQKQRIAIARALVRDPKILLLDEATSALDTESEASVQAALDKAREGRTTIVVAHRLSTIKTADVICGFKDGLIVETGTHDELMSKADGVYHTLVTNQTMKKNKDEDDFDDIDLEKPDMSRQISQKAALQRALSIQEEEKEEIPEVGIGRILSLNSKEWYLIVIGCFAALGSGIVQPLFAIIFSEVLSVFDEPEDEQESKSNFYSLMFLALGVGAGICLVIQSYMFAISGENLTLKLRGLSFRAMLRQEIGYFDDEDNATGALTARLANETSEVQGATGSRMGMFCQSMASIGTGVIIGFIYSWQLTLCVLAFAPFIMIGGMIEMKVLAGQTQQNAKALEHAGKIGVEAISNMRTVASLSKEEWFVNAYMSKTRGPHKKSIRSSHLNGMAFSSTQALIFFAYAAAFYLGAYLIKENKLNFEDMMKVFMAIVFGAMATGQASSFAPNYKKARIAANKLFQLLDRHTEIDSSSNEGQQPGNVQGNLEFRGVNFNYPSRPTVPVLQNLDLSIQAGQMIALVGSSGCGKSTTVQLIERFYNPLKGQLLLDGQSVDQLNINWLRKQMGIVSQEPVLFDSSIADNIAYGDNTRKPSMDEVIQAAKNANIHNFIASLPEGYNTNVGSKGTQLSGGQKQRVAIARALLRNPKILLLDEATSALDTESEKIVQEALDAAQKGRTSIVIAHRLSTIVNADCIFVFHQGQIREIGTHQELLSKKGIYFKLNQAQLRAK